MNAAELLVYLEALRDRNVPLHKVEVLVTVDGYDHITDTDLLEPAPEYPGWELYLADIITGRG